MKTAGFPDGHHALVRGPEFYDAEYRIKGLQYGKPWHAWTHANILWRPASKLMVPPLMDIGCGMGQLAEMCGDMGMDYACGVDVSSVAIEMAQSRMVHLRDHFVCGTFEQQSEQWEYETAVLFEVLEHVMDDLRLLMAIPKGKRVVASVPMFQCEGHCRWFCDAMEIVNRYSGVLDLESITPRRGEGRFAWWLFSGVRV